MRTSILLCLGISQLYVYADTTKVAYKAFEGWQQKGGCWFHSYIPGGTLTSVSKITAPKAVLNQKSILTMLIEGAIGGGQEAKKGGKGFKSSKTAIETAGKLAGSISKFSKIAAKTMSNCGPAMVAFGAVMGLLETGKPSIGDLKKATDKAFQDITDDVNNRFEQMTTYVEQKFIKLAKDNAEMRYAAHWKHFELCPDQVSEAKRVACGHDLIFDMIKELGYFMPTANFEKTSVETAKTLEVNLPVLVDVGNLLTTLLLDQILRYEKGVTNELTPDQKDKQVVVYNKYIKTYLTKIIKYFEQGVKYIEAFWDRNDCKETSSMIMVKEINEGLFNVNTANQYELKCAFNKYAPTETCSRAGYLRMDGKTTGLAGYKIGDTSTANPDGLSYFKDFLLGGMTGMATVRKSMMMPVIKGYWSSYDDLINTLRDAIHVYGMDSKKDEPLVDFEYKDEIRHAELKLASQKMVDDYMKKREERMDQLVKPETASNGYWMYIPDV